ncbi:MAG: DUF2235 domain-containing protein [Magnetococcales bacterium]|nr:DUF2235 domain-containing protein [Magnetococcales bacterium]
MHSNQTTNKNIIICSDGTGNKGGYGADTNVFRTYQSLDLDPNPAGGACLQKAFYDQGVGTQSNPVWKAIAGAVGLGFEQNILDAYTFLCRNYAEGDCVFLFGFSRGAATVRSLACMVETCGILKANALNPALIQEALEVYRNPRRQNACDWRRNRQHLLHQVERPILFMGLWDTVSALGFPEGMGEGMGWLFDKLDRLTDLWKPHRYHRYQTDKAVRHVYHALSIDDNRIAFTPKVWREPGQKTGVEPGQGPDTVEQVWFAGAHSDVGGGYPRAGLSHVAMHWMMVWAERHGLRFKDGAMDAFADPANVQDTLHNPRDGGAMLFRYGARDIEALCYGPGTKKRTPKMASGQIKIHESVLQRMRAGIDDYAPGFLPKQFLEVVHTPGNVKPFAYNEHQPEDQQAWQETQRQSFLVEEQQRFLFFIFGWLMGFIGLLGISFWQNPPRWCPMVGGNSATARS